MDWKGLRKQGAYTIAIVLGAAAIAGSLLPELDFRAAMIALAILALFLGWIP